MTVKLVPAGAVAALLILSVRVYGEEKAKTLTRARVSRKSLLKVSGRKRIREAFLDDVGSAAADLGWTVFPIDDGLALIETDSARSWTQVSTSRVRDRRREFLEGDVTEDDLFSEVLSDEAEDEEED